MNTVFDKSKSWYKASFEPYIANVISKLPSEYKEDDILATCDSMSNPSTDIRNCIEENCEFDWQYPPKYKFENNQDVTMVRMSIKSQKLANMVVSKLDCFSPIGFCDVCPVIEHSWDWVHETIDGYHIYHPKRFCSILIIKGSPMWKSRFKPFCSVNNRWAHVDLIHIFKAKGANITYRDCVTEDYGYSGIVHKSNVDAMKSALEGIAEVKLEKTRKRMVPFEIHFIHE